MMERHLRQPHTIAAHDHSDCWETDPEESRCLKRRVATVPTLEGLASPGIHSFLFSPPSLEFKPKQ